MIRFNPDPIPDMLRLLGQTQKAENSALQQLSTGRRVNSASDDPAAAAANIEDLARLGDDDQYTANVETLHELINTADSTLNSVVTSLQRALTIGIEGANGTQSAENRMAIAGDVTGIRDQILSLANLSFRGRFVFAGTTGDQPPFTADPTAPSGVVYGGNQQISQVQIDEGRTVSTNVPGDQVFMSSGGDVFAALNSLANALKANASTTEIGDCVSSVRAALDHISSSRVFYGNSMNQLDSEKTFLDNDKLLVAQHQNTTVAADPAKAASDLEQAMFARQATMQGIAKSTGMSLLDYLR